jgi:hypothetical protein
MTEYIRFTTHRVVEIIALLRQFGMLPAASRPLPVAARCRRLAPLIRLQHYPAKPSPSRERQ